MSVYRPVFALFFESLADTFSASGLAFGGASEDVFLLLFSLLSAAFVRVSLDGLPEAPWKVSQIRL